MTQLDPRWILPAIVLFAACSSADAEPSGSSAAPRASTVPSTAAKATASASSGPEAPLAPAPKAGLAGLDETSAKARAASIGYEVESAKTEVFQETVPLLRFNAKTVGFRFSVDLWDFGAPAKDASAGLGPTSGVAVRGPKESARKKLVEELLASGCQNDASCLPAIRKAGGTEASPQSSPPPLGPQSSRTFWYLPSVEGESYYVYVIAFKETAERKNLAFHSIVDGQRVAIIEAMVAPDDLGKVLAAIEGR